MLGDLVLRYCLPVSLRLKAIRVLTVEAARHPGRPRQWPSGTSQWSPRATCCGLFSITPTAAFWVSKLGASIQVFVIIVLFLAQLVHIFVNQVTSVALL